MDTHRFNNGFLKKKKEKGSGEEASLQTSPLQKQILPVLLLPIQNINSEALEIVYK